MPIVIAPVTVGLMALLGFIILYGLRREIAAWFGNLIALLARTTVFGVHVFGWLASGLDSAVQWMAEKIGDAAVETAKPITAFFSHLAGIIEYAAFTTAYVAEGAYDALWKLRHGVIPRLIHYGSLPAILAGHGAGALGRWIAREFRAAEAELGRVYRDALGEAHRAYAAAEHALERGLALDVPGAIRSLGRRLSRAEKLIIGGALTAAIVRVIARRLPWFRCSNVNRAAKGLCRTDTDLLDSLLADTLILAGSLSIVEFARECQKVEPYLQSGLRHLIRELD